MANQRSEPTPATQNDLSQILRAAGVGPTVNRTFFVPFAFAIPLACVWLLLSTTRVEITSPLAPTTTTANQPGLKLNPNTATWADLTLLPRIGEITAKRIVKHRAQAPTNANSPAFKQPSDLEAVRGIGPKTVEGIAPYLKFE